MVTLFENYIDYVGHKITSEYTGFIYFYSTFQVLC